MKIWPGEAYPLGATYDGVGTNFALFSEVADKVELCLFDEAGNEERVDLPEVDARLHPGVVEQAELDALGDLAEEGEVGADPVVGRAEGVGLPGPDLGHRASVPRAVAG